VNDLFFGGVFHFLLSIWKARPRPTELRRAKAVHSHSVLNGLANQFNLLKVVPAWRAGADLMSPDMFFFDKNFDCVRLINARPPTVLQRQGWPALHMQPNSSCQARSGWFSQTHPVPFWAFGAGLIL
jgi:hypothetical protein